MCKKFPPPHHCHCHCHCQSIDFNFISKEIPYYPIQLIRLLLIEDLKIWKSWHCQDWFDPRPPLTPILALWWIGGESYYFFLGEKLSLLGSIISLGWPLSAHNIKSTEKSLERSDQKLTLFDSTHRPISISSFYGMTDKIKHCIFLKL